MATSWDIVKTILPNGDERAYIFSQYFQVTNPAPGLSECQWAPSGIGPCTYFAGYGTMTSNSWQPGYPFGSIAGSSATFPQPGDWVSTKMTNNSTGVLQTFCNKCVAVIDKDTFLSGTCLECYNNGNAGNCSDNFTPVPTIPLPGDPGGCRYDNSINFNGIGLSYWASWLQNGGWNVVTYIAPNCDDCLSPAPPPPPPQSTLNFLQNCCDPSEQYQFSPTSGVYNQLVNIMGAVDTNAFRADLYIGGAQTGQKCWRIGTHLQPQLIPFAYGTTFQNTYQAIFPNCQQLQNYVQNDPTTDNCCGTPQTEWCCLTGVAGPPTTCTQVALGTCNPAVISNYSAGPFQTQQLCLAAGCATVSDPPYECDLPVAALINLQAKVKGFSDRRTQALSEPKADRARESSFKNTGTSTISPGTKIKSDSGGGTTDVSEGETNNPPPREGGGRPAPSNPYVDGGGY